jgi:hypothetical protein
MFEKHKETGQLAMSYVPTESRIFADRYFRDMRRLEAMHAGRLSPGVARWAAATAALYDRVKKAGSPVKQAAVLNKAIAYLNSVKPEERPYAMIAFYSANRSAQVCFATFDPGLHPLQGVHEEGLNIMQHLVDCDRNNRGKMISNVNIAYVSKHAMSRLHERGTNIDSNDAFASIAVLGHLARERKKA